MVLTRLSPSLIFLLNLLQERYHFHLGKMLEILFGGGGDKLGYKYIHYLSGRGGVWRALGGAEAGPGAGSGPKLSGGWLCGEGPGGAAG